MTWGEFGLLLAIDFVAGAVAYGLQSWRTLPALVRQKPLVRSLVAPVLAVTLVTAAISIIWALGHLIPIASIVIPKAFVPFVILLVGPLSFALIGVCVFEIKRALVR